jgi:predicted HTH domain antitoxin
MSKTLIVEYPETLPEVLRMSQTEFEREAKLAMAVKLFELGKVSSGQAAQLAGIPRVYFLYELGRFKISPFQYEEGELEQEVKSLEQFHDRDQH